VRRLVRRNVFAFFAEVNNFYCIYLKDAVKNGCDGAAALNVVQTSKHT